MTLFRRPDSRPDDSQVDEALRDLFEPTAAPSVRTGFDRRLARAAAADLEIRRRSRTLRRVLGFYWIVSAVASMAILWQLQDRLMSGLGLWLGVGGLVTLLAASVSFSVLAALLIKLGHRVRTGQPSTGLFRKRYWKFS